MYSKILLLLLFLLGIFRLSSAQSTQIKGTIKGLGDGQKITLTKISDDFKTVMVCSTRTDANGHFDLVTPSINPDIYSLHLSNRLVPILLDGGETVDVTATIEEYHLKEYCIKGSLYANEMEAWKAKLKSNTDTIVDYLEKNSVSKPLFHLFLINQLSIKKHLDLCKKVLKELKKAYPKIRYIKELTTAIKMAQKEPKAIVIGQKAPNVRLPDPYGKTRALSKLKGKVVLLNFWASWCKPCRITNPHHVLLYTTYKNKKFDLYSISLDGIDDRRKSIYEEDGKDIKKELEIEKEKWKKAIKDDQLLWKNHVSELNSWNSKSASLYHLEAIPHNFLLDKKGIIRYVNLQGKELEDAIKKLLNE